MKLIPIIEGLDRRINPSNVIDLPPVFNPNPTVQLPIITVPNFPNDEDDIPDEVGPTPIYDPLYIDEMFEEYVGYPDSLNLLPEMSLIPEDLDFDIFIPVEDYFYMPDDPTTLPFIPTDPFAGGVRD